MLPRFTFALTLALLGAAAWTRAQEEPVTAADLLEFIPDVVADYGRGEQLRGDEVRPLVAPQVQAMLANGITPTPDQVRAWTVALIDGMINQRLALQEAERHGVTVDVEAGRRLVADQGASGQKGLRAGAAPAGRHGRTVGPTPGRERGRQPLAGEQRSADRITEATAGSITEHRTSSGGHGIPWRTC